ncbi:MAG: GNAT family N-acetyltransferase [Bacteroidales bacterium]|nr:GNAT family N-acetyltransferase [Bacteroidales bacterium]
MMADATIEAVGMDALPQIVEMYNQIFRPTRDVESFRRRYLGRHNVLQLIARVDDRPLGFFIGFEQKPDVYYAWFYGVLPNTRRMGLGSQLMEAAQLWAAQHDYQSIRLECHNQHRPMLHLAIQLGYDIVGIRWVAERSENLIMFEKQLSER